MNNTKVLDFPATTTYQPEQALNSALKSNLSDVLIVAFDEAGNLYIRSSRMSRAEALFLLEKAKEWVMDPTN